ncbi:MAG: tetratricopeptide repeat protein, partial [Acidobacteriota bacterium]
ADALANLAAVTAELGDWPAAESAARSLLEADGDSADAWNSLGAALEGQGRRTEAADAYRRSLALDPGYWRARANLESLGAGGSP